MRFLLFGLLLIAVIGVVYVGFNRYLYLFIPVENQTIVYGVVRNAGLSPQLKKQLDLTNISYQLTSLLNGKYNSNDKTFVRFFLEPTVWNLSYYEGKCVEVGGVLNPKYDSFITSTDIYAYGGLVLTPGYITGAPANKCSAYPNTSIEPNLDQLRTFNGKFIRNSRPSPDINYDYAFIVSGTSDLSSNKFQAIPANNSIWESLEKNLDRVVTIQGTFSSGPSNILEVTKIQPL